MWGKKKQLELITKEIIANRHVEEKILEEIKNIEKGFDQQKEFNELVNRLKENQDSLQAEIARIKKGK